MTTDLEALARRAIALEKDDPENLTDGAIIDFYWNEDAGIDLAQAVLDLSADKQHLLTVIQIFRERAEEQDAEITRLKREVNAEIRYCNSLQNSAWHKLLTYPEVEEA